MYVMTAISVPQGLIRVYDTTDNSNEIVKLSNLLKEIKSGRIRVAGVSQRAGFQDSTFLASYGVYISWIDAKTSMANLYIQNGVPPREAYARVGLS